MEKAISEMIVRHVKVNRVRTLMEAIHATNRVEYLDDGVVNSMPRGTLEEVEVYFFWLKKDASATDVQKMLADRGLEPDPYALAAVNEADPAFAEAYPNATQWVSEKGVYCCLTFGRWDDERNVLCYRSEDDWYGGWWVGGVRKQSSGA